MKTEPEVLIGEIVYADLAAVPKAEINFKIEFEADASGSESESEKGDMYDECVDFVEEGWHNQVRLFSFFYRLMILIFTFFQKCGPCPWVKKEKCDVMPPWPHCPLAPLPLGTSFFQKLPTSTTSFVPKILNRPYLNAEALPGQMLQI